MNLKDKDGNDVRVASQAQANLNTVFGSIGLAGALMNGGNLLGLGGNNRPPRDEGDRPVTRYEMGLWQQINEEKTKNALLEAKGYTDKAMFDVQKQFGLQGAWNAAMGANVATLQKQLGDITKFVVPINSVDPVPTTQGTTTTQTTQTGGQGQ